VAIAVLVKVDAVGIPPKDVFASHTTPAWIFDADSTPFAKLMYDLERDPAAVPTTTQVEIQTLNVNWKDKMIAVWWVVAREHNVSTKGDNSSANVLQELGVIRKILALKVNARAAWIVQEIWLVLRAVAVTHVRSIALARKARNAVL